MKDYAYTFDIPKKYKEEEEDYFLYYEKENDKIIIYLSNGKMKELPYSIENENMVLERMEAQVIKYSKDFIDYYDEEALELIKKSSPFFVISSVSAFMVPQDSLLFSILNYTVFGVSVLAVSYGGLTYAYGKHLKKDYDKHKLFLDNKDLIQKGSWKDLRPLYGINKKAMNEAKQNLDSDQASININTVRLLKESELKEIISRINEKNKTYLLTKE